jgi:phosphatidate cytidylyltransferase
VLNHNFFRYLSIIIIIAGFYELYKLFRDSGFRKSQFFIISLLLFTILSAGFFLFSGMEKGIVLYTFIILSIFDSFSQITGQLWGKRKLFPAISPGKTVEGLAGGALISMISSVLIRDLINASVIHSLLMSAGVILFAFTGDVSSSLYKRNYHVKDFSNIIPGHGGFLDRFDSLITCGAWLSLLGLLINN